VTLAHFRNVAVVPHSRSSAALSTIPSDKFGLTRVLLLFVESRSPVGAGVQTIKSEGVCSIVSNFYNTIQRLVTLVLVKVPGIFSYTPCFPPQQSRFDRSCHECPDSFTLLHPVALRTSACILRTSAHVITGGDSKALGRARAQQQGPEGEPDRAPACT
jgi:hypothetical protein